MRTLIALPGDLRVRLYSEPGRSFHAKAYLFEHGRPGRGAAYIGSSNLSVSALDYGIEWNTVIRDSDDGGSTVVDFLRQFDSLFDSEFARDVNESLIEEYESHRRLQAYIEPAAPNEGRPEPRPAQREALAPISRLLREEGESRALVIAATGIGKTFLAAFDSVDYPRVLFIAHREELLRQAESAFGQVRPGHRTGLLVGERRDYSAELLFASVATLSRSEHLGRFSRDAFDYIVVDEFHHAAAESWRRILDHFTPHFLLGLTATPYRADNRDLFGLCDNNIAYRVTLFDAIGMGWLCPFRYFGIGDDTDYGSIAWDRGRYDEGELERALSNEARASAALAAYRKHPSRRALGFCSSIAHADFMAGFFKHAGVRCCAVHSGSGSTPRADAIEMLGAGELDVVFTVDVFNEGVDIPLVDLVMFLRPTESLTVFLQQLGRGLRLAPGKGYLTALDFIGNYRRAEYKLPLLAGVEDPLLADVDPRGAGGTRALLQLYERGEFQHCLPAGCTVELDLKAIDLLASAIAQQEPVRQRLVAALQDLARHTGRRPTLLETDLYGLYPARQYRTVFGRWFRALGAAGLLSDAESLLEREAGDFLRNLETTVMTRSYKMMVLKLWLNEGHFPLPLPVGRLVTDWRLLFADPHYRRDIHDTEIADLERVSDDVLRGYIERNPLRYWSEGDYFAYEPVDGVFKYLGPIGSDETAFRSAIVERVDWRLHAYFERKFERRNVYRLIPAGERKVCIMLGENPAPDTPAGAGWRVVLVDGVRYYAKFVRVAVNVIKDDPKDSQDVPNRLTQLMAELFHCSPAELAGKSVRLVRHAHDEAWVIEAA